MNMYGYTGKIARINLTTKQISTLDTATYEAWGGGHGIGTAIFWDLCVDKTIDGFNPGNVVTLMTSPLAGTIAPSVCRTEVQGIGVQAYPIAWYTRSNFGGRFAPMLKAAGWDGIVLEGASDKLVWINIVNDKVTIEDGTSLKGMDTWATQQELWRRVGGNATYEDWWSLNNNRDGGQTTQRPAVLANGPAGENLARNGCLVHDAGSAAGQGGFGGVWGSKKLKAISVIGTGSVTVADPKALMDLRLWLARNHYLNVDNPLRTPSTGGVGMGGLAAGRSSSSVDNEPNRVSGCFSCPFPCRRRHQSATYNDSQCVESNFYSVTGNARDSKRTVDMLQKAGVNTYDASGFRTYMNLLYTRGTLGIGKQIDSAPLDFSQNGTLAHAQAWLNALCSRTGIGNDMAEGVFRAAKKWGTLDAALAARDLNYPQWGFSAHWSLPEVSWCFGSLMGDRDTNEHCFVFPQWTAAYTVGIQAGGLTAEKFVKQVTDKMVPYAGDMFMLDYTWNGGTEETNGIYSDHRAKFIAWHRHHTRFWKQSMLFCDWAFPNFINAQNKNLEGFTPYTEVNAYKAVTGKTLSYEEGVEIGRKIWNADRAVWMLQGRTRELEKFAPFFYKQYNQSNAAVTVYKDSKWQYSIENQMFIDDAKFENWKTKFYKFEGWNTNTGSPTRATLESLGLKKVADELGKANKLG
jgi:aldehyde:ferredoxin oxidoreductase